MSEAAAPPSLLNQTVRDFLDRLASSAPAPGGGAAAALTGAASAALVSMVCSLTIGRPRFADVEEAIASVRRESEQTRLRLAALVDEDARAYEGVAAAYRMPRGSDPEKAARNDAIQRALVQAAGPPLETLRLCRSLLPLCLAIAAHGNPNVVSDAGVAAELAASGARASSLNVRVNLAEIKDTRFVANAEAEIATAETGLQDDLDRVIAIVRAKLAPKAKS